MRARWIAVLALPTLALVGCSSGSSEHRASSTTTSTTSISTTTTTSTTVPFDGSTGPSSSAATIDTTSFLRTIQVSHQGGVDRVTFQFDGAGRPGVSIAYDDHPVADGSGEAVAVSGGAAIKVRFEPASGTDLRGETPRRVYTGPNRVTGDATAVTEVVAGGDFEGVLTWYIGVRTKAPFRLLVLPSAPSQVTVELASAQTSAR